MALTICIIGRPNVGKSTLFNRIVGEQRALVHDLPGVTRDRLYATAWWQHDECRVNFTLIDTGGLEKHQNETINDYVHRQVEVAINQSDVIIALVDGQAGLLPEDKELIRTVRKHGKTIYLCVNKVDLNMHEDLLNPFYELGIDDIFPVSAQHNRGIDDLMDTIIAEYKGFEDSTAQESDDDCIRLAIVGRPNVGKSRLLNYLSGEERSIVADEPGTTRDPIDSYVTLKNQHYLLIDTAGIRRQAKINETLEYLTVLRSIRAVARSHIAILVIDATEGVSHQDLRLAEQIKLKGRGMVVFYNKCDLVEGQLPKGFPHFPHVPTCCGSAKNALGMQDLLKMVKRVHTSYFKEISTSRLNALLEQITQANPPPRPKGKQLHLRYATQVRTAPMVLNIFVNNLKRLTKNYKKYIRNQLVERLNLTGTPLRIDYRERNKE